MIEMNKEVECVKIQWIEFENLDTGLKIERIYFNEDITLLVGLSGVGKTQILNAVKYSLMLAVGQSVSLYPYRVGVGFLVNKTKYEWFYEIDRTDTDELLVNGNAGCEFSYEKLLKDGEVGFERNRETVNIIGYDKVPQPKSDESLISQYSEDKYFKPLISGIRKLYSVDIELAVRRGITSDTFSRIRAKVIETIENGMIDDFKPFNHLPVALKLYIAKQFYPDLFNKILMGVKELFVEIEDINVEEDRLRELYLVSIQVYGKKLMQQDISNGMLKVIYYIVELYTMSENSLVLIDEFENGLGVNCIDSLAELMFSERDDLQFIITSHHPKIINAIDKEKWKIIDRESSVVKNLGGVEYGIGNSKHDAYFNLINRWEFEGKI